MYVCEQPYYLSCIWQYNMELRIKILGPVSLLDLPLVMVTLGKILNISKQHFFLSMNKELWVRIAVPYYREY